MIESKTLDAQDSLEAVYALPKGEVVIGELAGLNEAGEPVVNFSLNRSIQPLVAISTITLTQRQVGRKVVLMFVAGDLKKPIILGLVYSPLDEIIENFDLTSMQPTAREEEVDAEAGNSVVDTGSDVRVDGKKVVLEAQEEVVLKCGDASITLNKSGKISIRGKYILNRSTGVNRILGGSVQVN